MKPKSNVTLTRIGDFEVEVTRKMVRNLRLIVSPPLGRVRLTLPYFVSDAMGREFVSSRADWIKKQQAKIASMKRAHGQTFENGDKIPYLGTDYILKKVETSGRQCLEIHDDKEIAMYFKPEAHLEDFKKVLDAWYRSQMQRLIYELGAKWESIIGVHASRWGIKRMKTRWGSCNTKNGGIWLNLELIKLDQSALEYVVVHELVHLLEASHNARFKALMTQFMPNWRAFEKNLDSHSLIL